MISKRLCMMCIWDNDRPGCLSQMISICISLCVRRLLTFSFGFVLLDVHVNYGPHPAICRWLKCHPEQWVKLLRSAVRVLFPTSCCNVNPASNGASKIVVVRSSHQPLGEVTNRPNWSWCSRLHHPGSGCRRWRRDTWIYYSNIQTAVEKCHTHTHTQLGDAHTANP